MLLFMLCEPVSSNGAKRVVEYHASAAFDWHAAKNRSNVATRGVSFDLARQIFDGFTLERLDDRVQYGEARFVGLGSVADETSLVVVHTERCGVMRLISARKATKRGRSIYETAFGESFER